MNLGSDNHEQAEKEKKREGRKGKKKEEAEWDTMVRKKISGREFLSRKGEEEKKVWEPDERRQRAFQGKEGGGGLRTRWSESAREKSKKMLIRFSSI